MINISAIMNAVNECVAVRDRMGVLDGCYRGINLNKSSSNKSSRQSVHMPSAFNRMA